MEVLLELEIWPVVGEELGELGRKGQALTCGHSKRFQRSSGSFPAPEHAAENTSNSTERVVVGTCLRRRWSGGARSRSIVSTTSFTLASSSLLQNEQCLTIGFLLFKVSEYHFRMVRRRSHPSL
jgi:hypothetical protein